VPEMRTSRAARNLERIPQQPTEQWSVFFEFLGACVGRALDERRPASPLDIARFIEVARPPGPVPPLYRRYLEEFGGGGYDFDLLEDASGAVSSLISSYEEYHGENVPPRGLLIGLDGLCGGRALLYSSDAREPVVVVCWEGVIDYICADSFRNLLYSKAFIAGYVSQGHTIDGYQHVVDLSRATKGLWELGFESLWFSDSYQSCLWRSDGTAASLYCTQDRLVARVSFVSDAGRTSESGEILEALGLKLSRMDPPGAVRLLR